MKVSINKDQYGIQICVGEGDSIRCVDVKSIVDVADIVNTCSCWLRAAQQQNTKDRAENVTQQLKAEIASCCDEIDHGLREPFDLKCVRNGVWRLRQLAAV